MCADVTVCPDCRTARARRPTAARVDRLGRLPRCDSGPSRRNRTPPWQILEGRVCIPERDGKIIGFSVVLAREDGDAELDGLFVDPPAWRNGIGTLLVRETERRAALQGARAMHVVANPRAEKFYLACGFAVSGEAKTRFGVARTMEKKMTGTRGRGAAIS